MKKITLTFCLLFLISAGTFALEVSKSELSSANQNTTIEFINYTGPHKKIESVQQIAGIGQVLGEDIANSLEKSANSGDQNRYYVIHAVDSTQDGKLDADIFIIGQDSQVDHITNLRRIIAGYLSSAYGYSEEDANTLAVFITVYNAVYRNDLDTFNTKYKDIVTKNLKKDICGLSTNYKDWPGQTQIVIPLYDVANGGLSTIDTSVISDTKVVQSMKEDDDKNIESRKDMVDLKEREADEASEKAKNSQKQATEEQKKLQEEKNKSQQTQKEADEKQKQADQAKNDAEKKQKIAEENPDDKQAQQDAQKAQKEAEQAQEQADKAQEQADEQKEKEQEQQEKTDKAKEDAKEQQALADKKQNEAQNERKEIAKDQSQVQKKEAEQSKMPTEFGIVLVDGKDMLSRLVKFNSETGEIIKNSPVTVIRNRTIYKANNNFIAVAGENTKNGAIKLVSINSDSLEIEAESENEVAPNSVLVLDGSDYYCVIANKDAWVIAKFNENLDLQLKSDVKVNNNTPITITDSGVVVTSSDGKLIVLDKKDLSNISK